MSTPQNAQSDQEPCCPEFGRTGYAHTEVCPGFVLHDPAARLDHVHVVVDTERHPFIGDGTLCTGILGDPAGPVCGNGKTAPVHRVPSQPGVILTEPEARQAADALDRAEDPDFEARVDLETRTRGILADILDERARAEEKFPGQHLPNGTPVDAERMGLDKALEQARRTSDMYRRITKKAAERGTLSWRHVLAEEFFEALAEHDPLRLRDELVQVASVALRWIEDIDLGTDRPTVIPPDPEPDGRQRQTAKYGANLPLPTPGDPAYDPDVHVTAAAQRVRDAAAREDH